jgi:indole-3-glycerol phosphate synthase
VIAEYKRASPSKGRFPVEIEPVVLASEYAEGGARAISVLTDEPFFQGSIADLTAAATVAHSNHPALAVLRKDFILDEYQILEARAAAADAILLIVGALGQPALTRLLDFAGAIGLDALVEVHDEEELGRAEAAGARIIGVNNRDLRTFAVDLATTERLASIRSQPSLLVAESGIHNRADVERLEAAGADAVLVGESLVLAKDRSAAIRHLRGDSARR